jgi:hypothetical protein
LTARLVDNMLGMQGTTVPRQKESWCEVAGQTYGIQPIMVKPKRRLVAAEKAEKKRRRTEFMWVFINGKQKRIKRPPTIDGMPVDEFILLNADPIWRRQNEEWDAMTPDEKP